MKAHPDAETRHGKLRDPSLKEGSRKITLGKHFCLFQETICFIRIREIGRCYNHIVYLVCQLSQNCGRSGACCYTWFMLNSCPIDLRKFSGKPFAHLFIHFGGVVFCPGIHPNIFSATISLSSCLRFS